MEKAVLTVGCGKLASQARLTLGTRPIHYCEPMLIRGFLTALPQANKEICL